MTDKLKDIEDFWNQNLCGKHFINALYPSKDFFEQYRKFRYEKEYHLSSIIDWKNGEGKKVLEIGLGLGADATRWALHTASFTGIDLTQESVVATKIHLDYLCLKGNILRANAEALPFDDNRFDIIYSHGVLHHSPNIEDAVREIYRAMKPGGELILMLYSKNSVNYWIRIQLYFRILFLLALFKAKMRLHVTETWKQHIANYMRDGSSYFSWNNWYHHCTDGPNCKIANIYYRREIVAIMESAGFIVTKMKKAHFPITKGRYPTVECFLAKYLGFYQFVWGRKA